MSDEDSKTPVELVEEAADHLKTSAQHEARAEDLSEKAEEELQSALEDELPDSIEVEVDAEKHVKDPQLIVSLYDESTTEIVKDAVGDDVDVGAPHPQQFIIGGDIIGGDTTQRERIQNVKGIIAEIEDRFEEGAPVNRVIRHATRVGIGKAKAEHEIDKLKQKGEVYEPRTDHLRTT